MDMVGGSEQPPWPQLPHDIAIDRLRGHLTGREPRALVLQGFRHAAVAVLLSDRGGVTHVTLTERAAHLRAHSGQVSFPGGKCDPGDPTFAATAIRECEEEIGVLPGHIDVLGYLDDDVTSSSFIVTPVIAELTSEPEYRPNPGEVTRVFEAPLHAFADRARAQDHGERTVRGIVYQVRIYQYLDHHITGATARILERLNELLHAPPA